MVTDALLVRIKLFTSFYMASLITGSDAFGWISSHFI